MTRHIRLMRHFKSTGRVVDAFDHVVKNIDTVSLPNFTRSLEWQQSMCDILAVRVVVPLFTVFFCEKGSVATCFGESDQHKKYFVAIAYSKKSTIRWVQAKCCVFNLKTLDAVHVTHLKCRLQCTGLANVNITSAPCIKDPFYGFLIDRKNESISVCILQPKQR